MGPSLLVLAKSIYYDFSMAANQNISEKEALVYLF